MTAKRNPADVNVQKLVASLNNTDTAPNPSSNPMEPMSRTNRAVPIPRTPAVVLDPMPRGAING